MLLKVFVCFALSCGVGFLRNDGGQFIEWTSCHETLLARLTLDVEDQAVCRELLVVHHLDDLAGFDVLPLDLKESFCDPRDHQILDRLFVYLIRNLTLSYFESKVSYAHESEID